MENLDHLLEIPAFLKRTPGDREGVKRRATRKWVMPRLDAKKFKAKKRPPAKLDVGTRAILHGLHWTDAVIDKITIREANQIADAGRIMQPADET